MPKLVEMDPYTTLFGQMEQPVAGPIVLINVFTVAPAEADQLIDVWARDAAILKRQVGFISAQFHRGVGGTAFLNYAVWESMADFKRAFLNPEFQAAMSMYPPSTVASPHIFQKLAVPDICVD